MAFPEARAKGRSPSHVPLEVVRSPSSRSHAYAPEVVKQDDEAGCSPVYGRVFDIVGFRHGLITDSIRPHKGYPAICSRLPSDGTSVCTAKSRRTTTYVTPPCPKPSVSASWMDLARDLQTGTGCDR